MSSDELSPPACRPSRRWWVVTLGVSAVVFLLLTNAARSESMMYWIAPGTWMRTALPLLLGALVILVVAGIFRPRWRGAAIRVAIVAALGTLITFFSTGVGRSLAARDEQAARAYPDRVASLLDSHHRSHGHYPDTLGDLKGAPPLPRLLHYRTTNSTYVFSYGEPVGWWPRIFSYSSDTRTWVTTTPN